MKIFLAAPLQTDSIVDGEGLRTVIWTQGCPHNCLGCHNPGTHDFSSGIEYDIKDLISEIKSLENQNGITLSGGEPFSQALACSHLAIKAHENNMNVWCYTGYLFEDLMKMSHTKKEIFELLNNIDVLIDGKFMLDFRTLSLPFIGSSNQRIIDVKKSLKRRKVILLEKYKNHHKNTEKTKVFI